MNTEEAREALELAVGKAAAERGMSRETFMRITEAADAYALAVLDEAKECVIPHGDLEQWDDEVLRERITRAGR